ncbi:MAG TPA: hypothetical protein VK154_07825 [Chitinophagales bacterium]|nr:hypothetical protein [Chitinophagales bacterium]
MWKRSDDFKNAVENLHFKYDVLSEYKSNSLRSLVYSKFTNTPNYSYPLWENLHSFKGVIFDFAWEWLSDLLKDEKVIIFFEEANDKLAFVIMDGSVIPQIMNECPAMTFYITNENVDFLYAYHHDHSIFRVCGSAKEKFEKYISKIGINVDVYSAN